MKTIYKIINIHQINEPLERTTINLAAAFLLDGEVVAFPTETVYGLGANALDENAVAKIFAAKGRPADNPLIVHVSDLEMAEKVAEFNPLARELAAHFWPGPLTFVLPRKPIIPDIVTAGLNTVAVRSPEHPVARAIIEAAALPIAAPSANSSGRPSPTVAAHVREDLDGKIAMLIDGGTVDIGLESTVLDLSGDRPRILRPGRITVDDLSPYCAGIKYDNDAEIKKPRSPGMKYVHYAPHGQVLLASTKEQITALWAEAEAEDVTPLLILFAGTAAYMTEERGKRKEEKGKRAESSNIYVIAEDGDLDMYARNLFAAFRLADAQGAKKIIVETVPEKGIGQAIMNRLHKAAGQCSNT